MRNCVTWKKGTRKKRLRSSWRLTDRRISSSILRMRFIPRLGMKTPRTKRDRGSTGSYQPWLTMLMDSQTFTLKSSNTEEEQDPLDPAEPGLKPAGSEVGKENRTGREGTEGTGSHNLAHSKLELPNSESDRKKRFCGAPGGIFSERLFAFEPASLTLSVTREANILSASRALTGLYSVA